MHQKAQKIASNLKGELRGTLMILIKYVTMSQASNTKRLL